MSTNKNVLRLLGAGIALALCSALPASAQEATVTRDAETGKLRAATAEEQAAMKAAAAAKARFAVRMAAERPQQLYHSSGARGITVTEEFNANNNLVAVRGADGKVHMTHGSQEAVAKDQIVVPTNVATE